MPEADAGMIYEIDPEYLEHAHHEALDTSGGAARTALGRLNHIRSSLALFCS
jgi:hypothetical protein